MILERYNDPIASIDERNVVAVLVYDLENDLTIDTGIVIAIKQPEARRAARGIDHDYLSKSPAAGRRAVKCADIGP